MRRIAFLAIGSALIATTASAQLDCGPDGSLCATHKYGLGDLPGYRADLVPYEENWFTHAREDFGPDAGGMSYSYSRSPFAFGDADCGPERSFFPFPGQILLRERTDCTPAGEGPTCSGGDNDGEPCHLVPPDGTPAGYVNPFRSRECPGGSCQDSGGGCPVEIPISNGGNATPAADASDGLIPTISSGVLGPTPWQVSAHSSNTFGGSSTGYCSNAPSTLCRSDAECGGGNTCVLAQGICQGGPTPSAFCTLNAQCGAGGTCNLTTCSVTNYRDRPSMGTRYILPASRGGDGVKTYIRWDQSHPDSTQRRTLNTALRRLGDDSVSCCASTTAVCNLVITGAPAYPLLNERTCATPNRFSTLEDSITNDWIFDGGRGAQHFWSDPDFMVPGQLVGVCKQNRLTTCTAAAANARCSAVAKPYDCCTGAGTGTCGTECAALGDTCDLTEDGPRIQITNARDAFDDPRWDACGTQLTVLRGTLNRNCNLQPRMLVPGDPGPNCSVFNFARDKRLDSDCDGIEDVADGCPFVAEWDQDKDTDGDCADGVGGDCRLDECECGDQSGDGKVNVVDIVAINTAIFTGISRQLCDANSDLICNVSDIVAANTEAFVFDSSSCRQITSSRCGNNAIDPGEPCDNGARCQGGPTPGAACNATAASTCGTGGACVRVGGDGCNTACRIESGWTCTGNAGEPSVCTKP